MRPIYVTNEEGAERVDDVLVRGAAIAAIALALCVAALAIRDPFVLAAFAGVGICACVAWWYRRNELRRDVRVPLDAVWDASVAALGENGFLFGETTWDGATEGRVQAGDASIVAERHPGGITRMRVRVGTFRTPDNIRRAGLILESLSSRLSDRRSADNR
jgi:uncharacterized RDD family membrane protein YckC